MKLRLSLKSRSIITILVIAMLGVGLACAGEKATPTSPPTATLAPTATATTAPTATLVPTATATLVPGEPTPTATAVPTATATAVPEPTATSVPLTWIQKYMQSPGYKPEWGQPQTGGTFKFGANRDRTAFTVSQDSGCYAHGCHIGLIHNALFRIDPWVGAEAIEGDLVETWEMSGDGLTLTMQLRKGVYFHDNPNVPAEYKGGKIRGDEFVCEDAKASMERYRWPPAVETSITQGKAFLSHLTSVTCPDGPRGHTFVMRFNAPLARTMSTLATSGMTNNMDKDFIEWIDTEHPKGLDDEVPQNFTWLTGTGPFVPVEFTPAVSTKLVRNPNYWREGLPLVDGFNNYLIKDQTTRFTALVTGNIHFYGEGSFSLTPGQVIQAVRDFADRVEVNAQLNMWADSGTISTTRPPFNDLRVRKALHLGLDRQAWREFRRAGPYEGMAVAYLMPPRTYWAVPEEEMWRSWPGIRQPKDQDIAEANRLLDEVFGKGKRPTVACMAVATDDLPVAGCLFIIDQLQKHLNWKVTSDFIASAVVEDKRIAGNFNFLIWSDISTSTLDPDDLFPTRYLRESASLSNKTMLNGLWAEMPQVMEEVESMARAQSVELDPVKRQQMVRDLEWKLLTEVYGHITIGWRYLFPAWRHELRGYRGYDYYSSTKWSMFERIWLAR